MKNSIEVFSNADEYLGEGAEKALSLKQRGYLYCGFSENEANNLQNEVKYLHKIGLKHIEFLDADEVRYRFPWLGNGVIAAKFDPKAGWFDSNALAHQYTKNTKDAKYLFGMENTNIIVENNKVVGVMTRNGKINTENVIIAAGSGSRAVGETAGITIPIVVRPRQSFTTPWRHKEFPEDSPFVIGSYPYPYVRPEAQSGAIFGWEYNWINKGNNKNYIEKPDLPAGALKDMRFPPILLALLARQFGHENNQGFSNTQYLRGVNHNAGYYVYRHPSISFKEKQNGTKNHYDSQRAIIDAWPDISGLFLSVAHVGHGIMTSPAAGEIIAAHVLGQKQSDPLFYQFGLNINYVENDSGGL